MALSQTSLFVLWLKQSTGEDYNEKDSLHLLMKRAYLAGYNKAVDECSSYDTKWDSD